MSKKHNKTHCENQNKVQRLDFAFMTPPCYSITKESLRLPKLLERAGVEYNFGLKAVAALKDVSGDASKIDWKALQLAVARESIGCDGQSAENVSKALLKHSPACADPANQAELKEWIKDRGPQLEAAYLDDRRPLGEVEANQPTPQNTPRM